MWTKTDAGRAEIAARARVKERSQRTLLLLIDGQTSDQTLLARVSGSAADDFGALEAMGLIEPVLPASRAAAPVMPGAASPPSEAPAPEPTPPSDYARFTAALTRLISQQLGLRGFTLTLAVEKAATIEELQEVGRRAVEQIGARKGPQAAEQARRELSGE